jgi:glycosyltransferase involved in cell wall biosynthesis
MEVAYNALAVWRLVGAVRRFKPDVIYERFSLFLLAGTLLRYVLRTPFVLEVNSPAFEERRDHDGLRLAGLGRLCQRWIWRRADLVLPVTDVLADYVRAAGVPEERILVVQNGIDPAKFNANLPVAEAKAALGLEGKTVIGFTGFVRQWNNLGRVVEWLAADAPADAVFLIVGDGPGRAALEQKAEQLGVGERMKFTGIVQRDAIAQHVAAFDIAVISGVTLYSSPLKLFEYMGLGKAVIAPDEANIREILTDGENAILAGEDDFAAGLTRIAGDPALCERLGYAGRAHIETGGFTWDQNAERIMQRLSLR